MNGMGFAIPWLGCKLPSSIPMLMLILKKLTTLTKTSIVILAPLFPWSYQIKILNFDHPI